MKAKLSRPRRWRVSLATRSSTVQCLNPSFPLHSNPKTESFDLQRRVTCNMTCLNRHHASKPWLSQAGRQHIRPCARPRRRWAPSPQCNALAAATAASDSSQPPRAVVLGAGMAGLGAAQVLSRFFDEVVILDRDFITHQDQVVIQNRRGVPQYQMPHGLLLGGLRCLNRLLPGFEEQLVAAGGVPVDWGLECDFRDYSISFARGPSPIQTICATRALFEHVVRGMVLKCERISLRSGSAATNILLNADAKAVTGVEVAGGEALPAALVVDASGRSSKLRHWLEAAGWPRPRELMVDAHVGYAVRLYKIPEGYSGPKAVLCGTRPSGTRSGLLAPIEGGRWNVILGGYAGDHPPSDDAGFLEFAKSLPAPSLYAAISSAEPLSPIMRYKATQNVRQAWEEVPLPDGLCVIGDAVAALNPIFGQGMTVAAKECLVLDELLHKRLGRGEADVQAVLHGFPAEFQAAVAATLDGPWSLAISEDLSFPGTGGKVAEAEQQYLLAAETTIPSEETPVIPPLVASYFESLALAASQDGGLCSDFCAVMHMAEPPAALFRPEVVRRVQQHSTCGCDFTPLIAGQ